MPYPTRPFHTLSYHGGSCGRWESRRSLLLYLRTGGAGVRMYVERRVTLTLGGQNYLVQEIVLFPVRDSPIPPFGQSNRASVATDALALSFHPALPFPCVVLV